MSNRIHQEVVIRAGPAEIYGVLTSADQFGAMTGGAATEIDPGEGGAFSCFGGMIVGRNIECAPGQRLVQAWRAKTWDAGTYSIARFELREEDGGTRIVLDHSGFPDGQAEHLEGGWHKNYWEPMQQHLS